MGYENQAYGTTNSIPGDDREYMEIGQLQQPSVGFNNQNFDPGNDYQALNNANSRPDNVYQGLTFTGAISGSQSEVQIVYICRSYLPKEQRAANYLEIMQAIYLFIIRGIDYVNSWANMQNLSGEEEINDSNSKYVRK